MSLDYFGLALSESLSILVQSKHNSIKADSQGSFCPRQQQLCTSLIKRANISRLQVAGDIFASGSCLDLCTAGGLLEDQLCSVNLAVKMTNSLHIKTFFFAIRLDPCIDLF